MEPSHSKIQITNPCANDWNAMEINSIGRFCESCAKSVVDFSSKSDAEIKAYILERKDEKICGRFYKRQVDRIRIELDQNILYSESPYWQKFLAIVLVCFGQDFLGYDFCFAQTDADSIPTKVEQVDSTQIVEQDSVHCEETASVDTIVSPSVVLPPNIQFLPWNGELMISGGISMVPDSLICTMVFGDFNIVEEISIVDPIEEASTPVSTPVPIGMTVFGTKPHQPKPPKNHPNSQKQPIINADKKRRKRKKNKLSS